MAHIYISGSNSYDPDGTNSSVLWEQVAGNTQFTLATETDLTVPAVGTEEDVLIFK